MTPAGGPALGEGAPSPSQAVRAGSTAAGSGSDELPEILLVRPIPGFPDLVRYVLVRLDEGLDERGLEGAPGRTDDVAPPADAFLYELRCVQAPDVRFLVGVPEAFFPEYSVEIDDVTCAELRLEAADDALVLVVLTISGDGASTTANLLAPVVINARERVAAQVILSGTDWPVRAVVA